MLIRELFEDIADTGPDQDLDPKDGGDMMNQLRQTALDVITPLLAQNVPFITMDQMIDALSNPGFGIVLTPALVMSILDPDSVKAVEKIEGDRIYLTEPQNAARDVDKDQVEQDADHTGDMAINQINQDMKGQQK